MSHESFMYNGWVYRLLEDKYIGNKFLIDETLRENLVLFMVKYRFSIDRFFAKNIKFIEYLLRLLPEGNKIRKYFAAQIQFVMLI
jgi:hypothetical protein